ncbi:single-stranded DNA-binding protein [Gimesia maris]|uniref:single-stranded DNA-binding protein n=1 Tax=Gimesia maris TaxID=122 RepID=UPI0032EB51A3
MAASFNKTVIVGTLGQDPDVRFTPSGSAVCDISLAVGRTWFDKNANTKRSETTWIPVTLWGRTAEVAGEYLKKGRSVLIEGRLDLDTWEDRETSQKRSKLKVTAENMTMLGSGGGSPQSTAGEENQDTYQDDTPF